MACPALSLRPSQCHFRLERQGEWSSCSLPGPKLEGPSSSLSPVTSQAGSRTAWLNLSPGDRSPTLGQHQEHRAAGRGAPGDTWDS